MISSVYTATVQVNEDGEYFIEFPPGMMGELNWSIGDSLDWEDNGDGTFTIKKLDKEEEVEQETEIVLVETISMFKMTYACRVPVGKKDWALDEVVMHEAPEVGQTHIDENIISHRVITKDEYIRVFDEVNDYLSSWPENKKLDFIKDI